MPPLMISSAWIAVRWAWTLLRGRAVAYDVMAAAAPLVRPVLIAVAAIAVIASVAWVWPRRPEPAPTSVVAVSAVEAMLAQAEAAALRRANEQHRDIAARWAADLERSSIAADDLADQLERVRIEAGATPPLPVIAADDPWLIEKRKQEGRR